MKSPWTRFPLPLCDEWEENILDPKRDSKRAFLNEGQNVKPYGTLEQFRGHLGRHMEQLALFALPMAESDELEDDGAGGDKDDSDDSASAQAANEYFVPRDGIDREVITADICSYLGNDALVRPGNYENTQTGQIQAGYFISAYRNLTTAMIADLKADSERWEAERRQTVSRGQPADVAYGASVIYPSRQYYVPRKPDSHQDILHPAP